MFSDIVIPNNNETEFIDLALKLKLKKLCFLYDFNEYNEEKIQKRLSKIKNHNINTEIGFLINQKNLNKAKQSKLLVIKSSDKDRFFIESKKIKLIYGFEELHQKDYLHQRASGLNHILCELARKNNITIGFSYNQLFNKNSYETSLLIGRIMQNISLCQKYKVKTTIASFSSKPFELRAQHDVTSLFKVFGMDDKKIKESISFDL